MPEVIEFDSNFAEEAKAGFKLRGRQQEWKDKIHADLVTKSRTLVVAPGGVGKTTLFAAIAADYWAKGKRTLVLENRDRLTEQTADRIRNETGLQVDVEKGDQRASPYAPIVVACVQSLSKVSRLTGFSENHFGLVVVDECHLCLSPSWLRIIRFFHWGSASLLEDWKAPEDGTYHPFSDVIGFTASPNLGDKRTLKELFHHTSVNYSYMDAIDEGWLVGPIEKNIPVKVDCRKFRRTKTAEGAAFNIEDQNAALLPIIKELAAQIPIYAPGRKGMAFVPSIEIAKALSEALVSIGVNSVFVSGECIDKSEKTDAFAAAGPGAWLVNCCLYTYGVDFPDLQCVAIFGPIISKVKYVQSVYRGTRVLPGVLKEGMSAEERVAAIASSAKKDLLILSPFYVSERIDLCEPFDLFGVRGEESKKVKRLTGDMTDTKKIRDYMAALEKAADPHQNKQPRTFNPVRMAIALNDNTLANYKPQCAADEAPPSREELDTLLAYRMSSVDIKTSGEAQAWIKKLMTRDQLGLARPAVVEQLTLRLGWPRELAEKMKAGQAGVLVGKRIRYSRPREAPTACYCNATSHPPCGFCENGGDGDQ
jgi:superfamily II DNA or RNA helicase